MPSMKETIDFPIMRHDVSRYILRPSHDLMKSSEAALDIYLNTDDEKIMMTKLLILEEWITNVIKYGYEKDVLSEIEIKMDILDNNRVNITCIDEGKAFDPTITPEPNVELELEKRNVGGLGIYFIRQALAQFKYSRINNQNIPSRNC